MGDLTFVDKLKEAVNTYDSNELLRLCCEKSKRKEILEFKDGDGHCLLHLVAGSGTVDVMRTLMDMGAGENEDNCIKETCLQTACSHGNTELVNYLLRTDENFKNADTRIEYNDCKHFFHYAAKSGNIETIKCLQNNGHLDINQIFTSGSTALVMLVRENDCRGVDTLGLCGADVNIGTIKSKDGSKFKAIHIASIGSKTWAEMVQILLKYGANVNEPILRSKFNQQPLFMALQVGNVGNASVLLEHGADILFKGETSEETIDCFCLAIKNCPSLVSEFIKRGANPNEIHRNSSVLMIALDYIADSVAIEALVKAGADIKFSSDGKNVIQCCKYYGNLFH